MQRDFDAVVVGARCAGATLGAYLARRGTRVLVVDADDMPSDQPMSTHVIGPYGMLLLDELGLGDRVRAIAPPIPFFWNGVEGTVPRLDFRERPGSCIRRVDLDPLLVDGAREHGATVELRTKVVDLVRDGDRVVGAVLERGGVREEVRARVVVGADGRHSTVASLVNAEEYRGYDAPRALYWAYWRRPDWFDTDPRYEGGAAIIHSGDDYIAVFPVNRDQVLVAIAVPIDRAAEWTGRQREIYLEQLRARPYLARFADGELLGKVISFVKGRFFFRRAAGPGWALVGDAGLFKDFTPGFGITDAFRDAKALAEAIDVGSDVAIERYWRQRDVNSVELFAYARDTGTPGFDNPLNRAVFRLIEQRPDLRARVCAFIHRELSPFAIVPTGLVLRVVLGELARGRFGVVAPFFAAGKNGAAVAKELDACKALLAALPPA
ncbi:MAG: NAD(P)/FAD-dependent oxidoreductase [Labilithrix sp.]|nr:NAD(P)/FAD-dependent oxidoreductase [Labilithrix sp.]MBX3223017.1 NAD(P)/FAD-dependent oxidoreductase [Labilithrix sp.]